MRSSGTAGPSPGRRRGVGRVGSRGSGARVPGRPSAYGPGGRHRGPCARRADDPVRSRGRSAGGRGRSRARSRTIRARSRTIRARSSNGPTPQTRSHAADGVRADPRNSEPGGRVRGTVIFVRVSKSFPQRWESDERDRSRWGEGAVHAGAGRRSGGGAEGESSGPETAPRPPASRAAPRSYRRPRTPPGARAGRARPATLRPGRRPLGPVAVPGRAPVRAPRPTEPLPDSVARAGVTPGTGTRPEAAPGRPPYAVGGPTSPSEPSSSPLRSPPALPARPVRGGPRHARTPAGPPGRPVVPPKGARAGRRTAVTCRHPPAPVREGDGTRRVRARRSTWPAGRGTRGAPRAVRVGVTGPAGGPHSRSGAPGRARTRATPVTGHDHAEFPKIDTTTAPDRKDAVDPAP